MTSQLATRFHEAMLFTVDFLLVYCPETSCLLKKQDFASSLKSNLRSSLRFEQVKYRINRHGLQFLSCSAITEQQWCTGRTTWHLEGFRGSRHEITTQQCHENSLSKHSKNNDFPSESHKNTLSEFLASVPLVSRIPINNKINEIRLILSQFLEEDSGTMSSRLLLYCSNFHILSRGDFVVQLKTILYFAILLYVFFTLKISFWMLLKMFLKLKLHVLGSLYFNKYVLTFCSPIHSTRALTNGLCLLL